MKFSTILIIVTLATLAATPWILNAVKFANCDFQSDWKCEVIHGAGVFIPPASFITVWVATDE